MDTLLVKQHKLCISTYDLTDKAPNILSNKIHGFLNKILNTKMSTRKKVTSFALQYIAYKSKLSMK